MQVQRAEDGSWVVSIQKRYTLPICMKYYFNPIQPTLIYIIDGKSADKTVIDYLIYTEIYIHYDLE